MRCAPLASTLLACAALAPGCSATANRSYPLSEPSVRFAAEEACVAAGFRLIAVEEGRVEGRRAPLWGVPVGSGGERIEVRLAATDGETRVEIVSELSFFGTLGQQHFHERVAELLDRFVREDTPLSPLIERRDPGRDS